MCSKLTWVRVDTESEVCPEPGVPDPCGARPSSHCSVRVYLVLTVCQALGWTQPPWGIKSTIPILWRSLHSREPHSFYPPEFHKVTFSLNQSGYILNSVKRKKWSVVSDGSREIKGNLCSFLGADVLLFPESAFQVSMMLRKLQSEAERARAWRTSPVHALHPSFVSPLTRSC